LVAVSLLVLFAPPRLIPNNAFQLGVLSKYLALAILALSVDLVWGYTGLLSLGQGLFFGLGAYCVAYSLALQEAAANLSDTLGKTIPPGRVPPDFMEYTGPAPNDPNYVVPPALEWVEPLGNIWVALAAAVLLPMLVALVFGLFAFRPRLRSRGALVGTFLLLAAAFLGPLLYLWRGPLSAHPVVAVALVFLGLALLVGGLASTGFRIEGVYFALITQAILLAVFTLVRNQQRVTGGVVGIKTIADFQIFGLTFAFSKKHIEQLYHLYYLVAGVLTVVLILCVLLVRTKFGKILTAIRDNENRIQALGYNTALYKTFIFTLAGGVAGLAGAMYVPANGLADPDYLSIVFSIEAVIWVAVGGRGTLLGPIVGAVLVGWANTYISSAFPKYWTIALGALFLLVVVFLPRGLVGKAGRGALLGAMVGILYVDSFVKMAQETIGASGFELTDLTSRILGCLFVLTMVFVPKAVLSVPSVCKRVVSTYRAGRRSNEGK
jgi:urea transport system permease protein